VPRGCRGVSLPLMIMSVRAWSISAAIRRRADAAARHRQTARMSLFEDACGPPAIFTATVIAVPSGPMPTVGQPSTSVTQQSRPGRRPA
jgi:hypothetical protein